MTLDITRNSFDSLHDFSGVLQQQGKVLLDSEHNEFARIVEQRLRVLGLDVMGPPAAGPAVVPRTTAEGFKITLDAAGTLRIGSGRAYVDGLLAENHGRTRGQPSGEAADWERRSEQRAVSAPAGGIAYAEQPSLFIPGPPAQGGGGAIDPAAPPKNAAYLVYLDVWRREVSAFQHPDLVEPALGFDTTGRMQTVWQVRLLTGIGDGVTCATKAEDIPGWVERTRPSGGRLTTFAREEPATEDLCVLPPGSGYRGLEHRTYRVEIHDGGAPGKATFKWARHHGSVLAAVVGVQGDRKAITVDRLGIDDELSIRQHDWIEVLDDALELAGRSGEVRRVEKIRADGRTVELSTPLTAGLFPVDGQGRPEAIRHMRVRRWDQKGTVFAGDPSQPGVDVTVATLDGSSSGVIPVPVTSQLRVRLEDGVEISFSTRDGGEFRPGDAWTFVARAASGPGGVGTVEKLIEAPPRGVHHHYCRLAVVSKNGQVADCRVLWPPEGGASVGCGCTVCVEATEHAQGLLTIQQAIDQVIASGGGTVCLGPGEFRVDEGVRIEEAKGLRLCGHGVATTLIGGATAPCIWVRRSVDVTIDRLQAIGAGVVAGADGQSGEFKDSVNLMGERVGLVLEVGPAAAEVVAVEDCLGVRVERCVLKHVERERSKVAVVGLGGALWGITVGECALEGAVGVGLRLADREKGGRDTALFLDLRIWGNVMAVGRMGVAFDGHAFHAGRTIIEDNLIGSGVGGVAGVSLPGVGHPLAVSIVRRNMIMFVRHGVRATLDGLAIEENRIAFAFASGVLLRTLDESSKLSRARISRNEIYVCMERGVELGGKLGEVVIEGNAISHVGAEGIAGLAETDVSIQRAIAADNRIDLAGFMGKAAAGIVLARAEEVEVRDNRITRVGTMVLGSNTSETGARGVTLGGCRRSRVRGNSIGPLGSSAPFKMPVVGIEVLAATDSADVLDNQVMRDEGKTSDGSPFVGIRVGLGDGAQADTQLQSVGGLTFQSAGKLTILRSAIGLVALQLATPSGPRPAVAVRGNRVVARGAGSAAEVSNTAGAAAIADNRLAVVEGGGAVSALLAKAAGLVVADNVLECSPNAPAAVLTAGTDKEPAAVVHGNLFRGAGIQLNGTPTLPSPWDKLNVKF